MKKFLSHLVFASLLLIGLLGPGADMAAAQTGQIYGQVLDGQTSSPIPFAQIFSLSYGDYVVSDFFGNYSLDTPSGSIHFHVYAPGYQPLDVNIFIPEGSTIQYNFYLTQEGGISRVSGTVIECGGEPIRNALVQTDTGVYTYTNDSGTFSMELSFGDYGISISANGYYSSSSEILVDDATEDLGQICLYPEASLGVAYGVVTDSQTGIPIAGAVVRVSGSSFSVVTFFDGFYWMEVPSGDINLVVEASGYVSRTTASVTITSEETSVVNIALDPEGIGATDDHCNQPDDCATDLEMNGEAIEGNIEADGDEDWFKFQGTSGVDYEIETSDLGSGSDTVMTLYGSDGTTIVAEDDDGGEGLASKIVWTADQDALFYVEVTHFSSSDTGTYKISVKGSDDHCNTPGDCATELQPNGSPRSGRIEEPGDTDWFRFAAVSGLTYEMETFDLGEGSDTVMILYDSDETTVIAENDDWGEGYASKITWVAESDGTFYVMVRHYSETDTGSYHVRITGFDDHCNRATSCATYLIPNDTPISGTFEADQDEDWFQFQAISGVEYQIETGNMAGGCDTYLYLYGPDGKVITFNDDGGDGLSSRIVWTPSASDIYYALVKHYDPEGRGTYDIFATVSWATLVKTDGTPVSGSIEFGGDVDIFLFQVEAARAYVLETSNLSSECDTYIKLYEPDGDTLISEDDDGGTDVASKIAFTATITGIHYVLVYHWDYLFGEGDGTGTYDISIQEQAVDDHSNVPGTDASNLDTNGTQVSGRFESPGDADWFSFVAQAGQQFVIETGDLEDNCDTVMEIYDTDGSTLLVWDDDSGDGLASRLEWLSPSSGTFYIRLTNYAASGTGGYRVWVRALVSDDHGDTPAIATQTGADGTSVSGQIEVAGDVDWFQFVALSGAEYAIETSGLDDQCDTVIELYAPDGSTLILSDDDSGEELASRIVWSADTQDTYYVRVHHYSPEGTGGYELSIDQVSSACTSINPGEPVTGTLSQAGDSRVYCLNVNDGDEVTVTLNGPQAGADFDVYLKWGSPPTLLDYDARGFTSTSQENCDVTAPSTGILYIRIVAYSGIGDYTIQADVTPTALDCVPLTEDVSETGALSGPEDGELYCIDLDEGDPLMVTLDGPDSGSDFDLYLKLGSPPTLSDYDARGYTPFSDEIAALTAESSDKVYVWVVSYSGGGPYSLEVQVAEAQLACTKLEEGVPQQGSLSFPTDERLYCFDIGEDDKVRVSLSGPATDADFDLYLKFGEAPTIDDPDALDSTTATSQEQISFTSPSAGTLYILAYSYSGIGDFTIRVDYVAAGQMTKMSVDPSQSLMVRGRIVDKITQEGIQPNRFCIQIKDVGKFCYNLDPNINSNISFIPGGYFFFIAPKAINRITCTLTDVPCYKNMQKDFTENQTSNILFEVEVDEAADCDGDNMDTGWEKRHGLNIWKNDAQLDLDQDGYRNKEEYDAGSNPNDKDSIPQTGAKDTISPTVVGLINDANPAKSKTWNWSADEPATFRYVIDKNPSGTPSGDYTDLTSATQATGTGTYYIHVQAKDLAGNESDVVTVSAVLVNLARGDINGDENVDLVDAIIALHVLAGMDTSGLIAPGYAVLGADVNGDGRVGLQEVIYIMQKVAEIRQGI